MLDLFANPLGLLGLAAVPAVVAIHLFQRRFPPMEVAGLHLWGVRAPTAEAGRRRDRLPVSASLILEVLLATLLALLLAQPRWGATRTVRHVVAVLDGSASMSAEATPGETFADRAVATLADRDATGPATVWTVVASGPRPVVLAGPRFSWDEAVATLDDWEPQALRHDPRSAWELAGEIAGENGSVLYVTDRDPAAAEGDEPVAGPPASVETVAVGLSRPNVAITSARWDRGAAGGEVFLRLANFSEADAEVTVAAVGVPREPAGGGTIEVFRAVVSLDANGEKSFAAEVAAGIGELVVRTRSDADALALDSGVTLLAPPRRVVGVANTLPEEHPFAEPLGRVLDALPGVAEVAADRADLRFGVGISPDPDGERWSLSFGGVSDGEAGSSFVGPYLIDERDPLTAGVTLAGVIWSVPPGDATTPASVPLVSVGERSLLYRRGAGRDYVLDIDPRRTNLPLTPDWPVLIANFVEARRDALPGARRRNVRVGEPVGFTLPAEIDADDPTPLTVARRGEPTGRPVARTRFVELPSFERAGIYEVRDGDEAIETFAAQWVDPAESSLLKLSSGRTPAVEAAGVTTAVASTWPLAVAAAVAAGLLFADWNVLKGGRQKDEG